MSVVVDQQPDSFSWTSTMKDIVLSATENVIFTLQVDNKVILTETYTPDSLGKINIRNLGKVCRSYLNGELFPVDQIQHNLMKIFTSTINGTTRQFLVQRCDAYLKQNVLLLSAGTTNRITTLDSVERLSLFTDHSFFVSVLSIANEDLSEVGPFELFSPSAGTKIYTVDVSPSVVQSASIPFDGPIIGYKIEVGGLIVTYLLENAFPGMKQFLYLNSFGVPDTITLFPETKQKISTTSETAIINDTSYRFNIQRNDSIEEGNILFHSIDALNRLRDMFSSEVVKTLIDGEWIDILITDLKDENVTQLAHVQPISFNYKIANPKYGYRL